MLSKFNTLFCNFNYSTLLTFRNWSKHYHFTTTINRVFFDANSEFFDDEAKVGPDAVDENDQRTMHQYITDAVNNCLAEDDLVETIILGALFYGGKINFRNIQDLATPVGNFLRSNHPSSVVGDVRNTFMFWKL